MRSAIKLEQLWLVCLGTPNMDFSCPLVSPSNHQQEGGVKNGCRGKMGGHQPKTNEEDPHSHLAVKQINWRQHGGLVFSWCCFSFFLVSPDKTTKNGEGGFNWISVVCRYPLQTAGRCGNPTASWAQPLRVAGHDGGHQRGVQAAAQQHPVGYVRLGVAAMSGEATNPPPPATCRKWRF